MSENYSYHRSRKFSSEQNSSAVSTWLFICCALVFAMVIVGGLTRLTQSGLSMVDWEPIRGILPPLSNDEWVAEFGRYQQSPEYKLVNKGMSLDGFKRIFWWEYGHRLLGRLIGLVFFIPLVYFAITRKISVRLLPWLVFAFVLGGLQGLLGWYMVQSGLVDNPHVSQWRLTAHLSLAVVIYWVLLWMALDVSRGRQVFAAKVRDARLPWAAGLCVLVFMMIVTGGFMAGTHAGHVHNTFPMIDGSWFPANSFAMTPWWLNFFENVTMIQVVHRYLAMFTVGAVVVFALMNFGRMPLVASMLLVATTGQFLLGVITLLLKARLPWAALHQGGAMVLLTVCIIALYRMRSVRP